MVLGDGELAQPVVGQERNIIALALFDKLIPDNRELAERGILAISYANVLKAIKAGEITPTIKDQFEIFDGLVEENQSMWFATKDRKTERHFRSLNCFLRQHNVQVAQTILKMNLYQQLIDFYLKYQHVSTRLIDIDNNSYIKDKLQIAQTISDTLVLSGEEDFDLTQVEIGEE
jgi:hypothetical protein